MKGLYLQADLDFADNYRGPGVGTIDTLLTEDVPTLFGFQINGGYRFEVKNKRISAAEPIFRFDYVNPDRDEEDDANYLITPGINLYLHLSRERAVGWKGESLRS
jgi:hypothetical protein